MIRSSFISNKWFNQSTRSNIFLPLVLCSFFLSFRVLLCYFAIFTISRSYYLLRSYYLSCLLAFQVSSFFHFNFVISFQDLIGGYQFWFCFIIFHFIVFLSSGWKRDRGAGPIYRRAGTATIPFGFLFSIFLSIFWFTFYLFRFLSIFFVFFLFLSFLVSCLSFLSFSFLSFFSIFSFSFSTFFSFPWFLFSRCTQRALPRKPESRNKHLVIVS